MKFHKNQLIGLSPNSKLLREYKQSLLNLSTVQWEAAIGLMLGDASLQTQNKGETFRIEFEWGNKNKPYLDHVYNLFDDWVLSLPHEKVRFSPRNRKVVNWGFQTFSHKAFLPLAELFIKNNKKTVDDNLISKYLSPRGLAYWFMDDGGKLDYNRNSKSKVLVLNTQSFSDEEVKSMTTELDDKFNLDCETRPNKGRLTIIIKNYDRFMELCGSSIIAEMKYKLPNN